MSSVAALKLDCSFTFQNIQLKVLGNYRRCYLVSIDLLYIEILINQHVTMK